MIPRCPHSCAHVVHFFSPWFKGGGSSLKEKINNYELPTRRKGEHLQWTSIKSAYETLKIYQINQNKSIGYENK